MHMKNMTYEPLEQVARPFVNTEVAAYYLGRRPQTLRVWACREAGPIRPVRVYGRLAWPIVEIRRLLGMHDVAVANASTPRTCWEAAAPVRRKA